MKTIKKGWKKVMASWLALLILASIGTSFLTFSVSAATTIIVAKSGGDYSNIQDGVNAAMPGDTVLVQAGTYNEIVYTARDGSSGNRITLRAEGTVNINGARINHDYFTMDGFYLVTSSEILITGDYPEVLNNDLTCGDIYVQNGYAPTGGLIKGNHLHDAYNSGDFPQIQLFGSNFIVEENEIGPCKDIDAFRIWGHDHVIRNNYVHDITFSPGSGAHMDMIQIFGDNGWECYNNVIENNRFINSKGQICMLTQDGVAGIHDLIIRNNVFANITQNANLGIPGISLYNNTFYNTGCFSIGTEATNLTIKNNILVGMGGLTGTNYNWVYTNTQGMPITKSNNFYSDGSGNGIYNYVSETGGINGGNINFTNPASYDFHLNYPSPALESATSLSGFDYDIEGTERPQGYVWDIGAYEYVWQGPVSTPAPTPTPTPTPTPLAPMNVAYWRLDETSGSSANDNTGNGHTGTLSGAAAWYPSGRISGALSLNSGNEGSGHVTVPDTGDLDFGSNDFSVAFWVFKRAQSSGWSDVWGVTKWNSGASPGTNEWGIVLTKNGNDDIPRFLIESGSGTYSAYATSSIYNGWHHIVGVRDGSTLRIYVDGSQQGTASCGTVSVNNAGLDLYIGSGISNGNRPNAIFDDLRVYTYALSASEVSDIYNYAGGPTPTPTLTPTPTPTQTPTPTPTPTQTPITTPNIAYWKLDETSGSSAYDDTGNGHTGTLSGAAARYSSGKINGALSLNSSNEGTGYVTVPDAGSLDFGSNNFSVAFWVFKRAQSSGWSNTWGVNKWNTGGSPGTNEWCMSLTTNGSNNIPSFLIESGSTTYTANATSNIYNGWHHIVGVRDGGTLRIYVDGSQQGTASCGTAAVNNVGRSLYIGTSYSNIYRPNAIFDDVRIYNRALSASEVTALYNYDD